MQTSTTKPGGSVAKTLAPVFTHRTVMPSPLHELKSALRKQIRQLSKGILPDQKLQLSVRACALLERQPSWKQAQSIFFYAPLAEELDIWPLVGDSLAAGKVVCLPRFDSVAGRYAACQIRNATSDVVSGQFSIREPATHCVAVPLNRLDLVLVPGVAFDLRGHRLGRGKGFYDQLLESVRGLKCGVAFDEQIVTEIPVEPHDVSVDCILTPTRWLEFKL
jgi:5-formyltetrahydrofolate cyclo-ligase